MKDYTWYEEQEIQKTLKEAFTRISTVPIHEHYTLSKEAFAAYEEGFRSLLSYGVAESFYRRLMYRSFKYALIFHVINGDPSSEITPEDVAWSMRLIDVHLVDLKELLKNYNYGQLEKMIRRIQEVKNRFTQQGKPFGTREIIQYERNIKSASEARQILQLVNEIDKNNRP